MIGYAFGESVTLHARAVTGQDTYGNDVYGSTDRTVVGAFAPAGSAELVQGRDTVTTQPAIYLPPGTDVTAVDQATVRGVTYDVDGTPADWRNPFTGRHAGIVVNLLAVTG